MIETNNFKLTNQRKLILDFVKDNYTHPTVEEVYLAIKEKLPQISKKTAYLNLEFLAEKNMIKEIKLNGIKRYEPIQENHIHAICKNCKKIIDIQANTMLNDIEKLKKQNKDFKIESSTTTLHGICKECQGGKKNGK